MRDAEDLAIAAGAIVLALGEHYLWRRLLRAPVRRLFGVSR